MRCLLGGSERSWSCKRRDKLCFHRHRRACLHVENVAYVDGQIDIDMRHPHSADVAVDQLLIGEIERGDAHLAVNHVGDSLEEPLVVRRERCAVCHDERGLSTSPGAARSLRVVGGGWRNVPHVHHVERRDVDPELHRR